MAGDPACGILSPYREPGARGRREENDHEDDPDRHRRQRVRSSGARGRDRARQGDRRVARRCCRSGRRAWPVAAARARRSSRSRRSTAPSTSPRRQPQQARDAGLIATPHAAHGDVVDCIATAATTLERRPAGRRLARHGPALGRGARQRVARARPPLARARDDRAPRGGSRDGRPDRDRGPSRRCARRDGPAAPGRQPEPVAACERDARRAAEDSPRRLQRRPRCRRGVVLERLASGERRPGGSRSRGAPARVGPNALAVRRVSALAILVRQLRNPLLLLLLAAAAVSGLTGDPTDAAIIARDRRAERRARASSTSTAPRTAVAALHSRHPPRGARRGATASSAASTSPSSCPATSSRSRVGDIVPADLRLLERDAARVRRGGADRRVAAGGQVGRGRAGERLAARPAVVRVHGHGRAPGRRARRRRRDRRRRRRSARSPPGSARRQAETAFQVGLRGFSRLLVNVAGVLTVSIFVINVALLAPAHRRAAVLARDRDRHHAAAPAGDRVASASRRGSRALARKRCSSSGS